MTNHSYHRRLAVLEGRVQKFAPGPARPSRIANDPTARQLLQDMILAKAQRRVDDVEQLKREMMLRLRVLDAQEGGTL